MMQSTRHVARLSGLQTHMSPGSLTPTATADAAARPQIRLGIIGLGNMGGGHVQMLEAGGSQSVRLVAVCDEVDAKLQAHAGKGYALYADALALIGGGEVDAVLIRDGNSGGPREPPGPLGLAIV